MNPQQPQQQPFFNQPFTPPQQPIIIPPTPAGGPTNTPPTGSGSSSKMGLIIGVIAGVELLIIGLLLVLVLTKSPAAPSAKTDDPASKAGAGVPATSASVQQINDAMSQDISGLNDDKDFPVTKLDDKALGL